ncbi:MAG: cytochrome c [Bryobacteraceae bacterium]
MRTRQVLCGVGQASTPAAGLQTRPLPRGSQVFDRAPGVHAGLLGQGKSGSWRTRADLEVCPTIIKGLLLPVLFAAALLTGCRQDMQDQPKYIPLRPSSFFADGRSERPLVEGTVARGHLDDDTAFYTGKVDNKPVDAFPFPITRAVLERGQERFNIYCAPCHDRLGNGHGMIVQRGLNHPPPPSYHIDRLRQVPVGYLFDVIGNGLGAMPDYAAQIETRDRWAIVAYVRVLQLSQNATLNDVPPEARAGLTKGGTK